MSAPHAPAEVRLGMSYRAGMTLLPQPLVDAPSPWTATVSAAAALEAGMPNPAAAAQREGERSGEVSVQDQSHSGHTGPNCVRACAGEPFPMTISHSQTYLLLQFVRHRHQLAATVVLLPAEQ